MPNLLLQTDSYKFTHHKQYPQGTEKVYSYLESRGGQFPYTVFFGLQYYLEQYLADSRVDLRCIKRAKAFVDAHIGPGIFNEEGWHYIAHEHCGILPVEIKAVPEGTVVPTGNVLMTIENTDPKVPWLTNFLETMLLKVWYPTTVATQSRAIKQSILKFLEETGDPSLIDFKLHDFGYRGVSSEETAGIGGAAHLINFKGTDTVAGIQLLSEFYDGGMSGFSIPATEHSTVTSWGKDLEGDAYDNLLEQFPTGLIACVSDSYDIFNAIRELWGNRLREKVLARDGVLVIRPDSGDPASTVLACVDLLGEKFGYTINSKGFKVLCPKVRLIQGDGVNYWSIQDVLRRVSGAGWSADNVAFGMGGALLQQLNRDTQKFAIKCSNVTVNGKDRDVFKQPLTDSGKNSKAGRLGLFSRKAGDFTTMRLSPNTFYDGDQLETVFRDGVILKRHNLEDIRQRARIS